MDFLEDLWILLLLPPLLSAALSTATHSNIFGNSKLEADGERSREDPESDKLSCWGPMGAVEP